VIKNRNNTVLSTLCDKVDLFRVVHTYAPTADFKCLVDSSGADIKTYYRQFEKMVSGDHCVSSYMVYKMLVERMGQPTSATDSSGLMHVDRREHYYMCNTTQVPLYAVDIDAIILVNKKFEKDTKLWALDGIRVQFQIRSHKQLSEESIVYMCNIQCSCDNFLTFYHIVNAPIVTGMQEHG